MYERIIVLGAGAVGSAYAAFLSRKHEVIIVGNEAHVRAVNSQGLTIVGDGKETFHLRAMTKIDDIPAKTLVILTTKAYDTARAMDSIKDLLKDDTIILILQNGLGNEEIVRNVVGSKHVIVRGVTSMSAELLEPGLVQHWKGETVIGQNDVAKEMVELFKECGLGTKFSDNIKQDVWSKLVVNCVVNPLTAILGVTDGAIIVDSLKPVRNEIVAECLRAARAEGIKLPDDSTERIDRKVVGYSNFSSMYHDLRRGKRTEIDFLNGKIVELCAKHRIPAPMNVTLVCFIRFLEGKNGISRQD
jgi:2-dehydropantoate 2-reductase